MDMMDWDAQNRHDGSYDTKPVTLKMRAAALTAWFREHPSRLRFTRGMSQAAERMERRPNLMYSVDSPCLSDGHPCRVVEIADVLYCNEHERAVGRITGRSIASR